jgi:hypothetical protein
LKLIKLVLEFKNSLLELKVCSKPFYFIVKSKPTAIFTVVFRGVSAQTAIGLDLSVVSRGVQVSLGYKDILSCLQPWCSVVFPWCPVVFRSL